METQKLNIFGWLRRNFPVNLGPLNLVYCQIRYTSHLNVRVFQYTACTRMISAVWIEKNNGAFVLTLLHERLLNYYFLTTGCIFDGYDVTALTINRRGVHSGAIAWDIVTFYGAQQCLLREILSGDLFRLLIHPH